MEASRVSVATGNLQAKHKVETYTSTMNENETVASEKKKTSKKLSDSASKKSLDTSKSSAGTANNSINSSRLSKSKKPKRSGKSRQLVPSRRDKQEVSSDSDDYSVSESDDDSLLSDGSSSSSSLDEGRKRCRHEHRRSRRSRRSRSVSRHVTHRSRTGSRDERIQLMGGGRSEPERENDALCAREAEYTHPQGFVDWEDAGPQRDMYSGDAVAQLESRYNQLQLQVDKLSGIAAPTSSKPLIFEAPAHTLAGFAGISGHAQSYRPPSHTYAGQRALSRPQRWSNRPKLAKLIHSRRASPVPGLRRRMSIPNYPALDTSHSKSGKQADFKRVDSVWDSSLFAFKLQQTRERVVDPDYDQFIFYVRRIFDNEDKYLSTVVDVKSKLLRECLQDVIGDVRGVNLVDETPNLDPNLLFLYLEDFRSHLTKLKEVEPAGQGKREQKKNQLRLDNKRRQLKVLIKYLDKDYAEVKESLYPMLDRGIITFEYLWALWKPNTLVYSPMYGFADDPRIFKVDIAVRQSIFLQGDIYLVDGKYLEFDGKRFGHGTVSEEIPDFQGTRKITSLPFYPLSYHKDETGVRRTLIERGKKFVALHGAHYKAYSGIAYLKRKKNSVVKFHVQPSRVMVDPATFRRINPNYVLSHLRPTDSDALSVFGQSDVEDDLNGNFTSKNMKEEDGLKVVSKTTKDSDCSVLVTKALQNDMQVRSKGSLPQFMLTTNTIIQGASGADSSGEEKAADTPEAEDISDGSLEFTDEDYLLASPVVLGFSFSEKEWLELAVSRVEEIKWNEGAWDSLVLPSETKDLIQALVKSRKHNATQTIDDVIQGKGKGLVTVLHGPPGTGKTLTAEGISELLQCPLYMASAGELGTDSRFLEASLQKILDVCHAWGAILLLDEADVFLEKRNMQDIHRNALVSVFLRQLEYFQGILFLTTNRVETFDEAFQSRIHIALRYEVLDSKAKKTIFKMFIDRVEAFGKLAVEPFSDDDLNKLAKHDLNGREIKNTVGSAQDLAINKNESLGMRHIQQVLDIHVKFGRDLRGGPGYEEAMRSYC